MIHASEANKITKTEVHEVQLYFDIVENKIKEIMRLGEEKEFGLLNLNYGHLVFPDYNLLDLISQELQKNEYTVSNIPQTQLSHNSQYKVTW